MFFFFFCIFFTGQTGQALKKVTPMKLTGSCSSLHLQLDKSLGRTPAASPLGRAEPKRGPSYPPAGPALDVLATMQSPPIFCFPSNREMAVPYPIISPSPPLLALIQCLEHIRRPSSSKTQTLLCFVI